MAKTKITVSDAATGVDVGFEAIQTISGSWNWRLTLNVDQQPVDVTYEQFRLIVDALMDMRKVLADVKKQASSTLPNQP